MKHLTVAWLSAGVSSFIAAYLIKDEIDEFYYIDIADQHPDSMRFIKDCEKLLGKEIKVLKSKQYDSVEQACCAGGMIRNAKHAYPLIFIKQSSAQALKANMKILGGCEYAVVLYRDKLPKFNNNGKMVLNWFNWLTDGVAIPKIHPTQKPVRLLKRLIEIFTDYGDVVIDPCAGSASTLVRQRKWDEMLTALRSKRIWSRMLARKCLRTFSPIYLLLCPKHGSKLVGRWC